MGSACTLGRDDLAAVLLARVVRGPLLLSFAVLVDVHHSVDT